LKKTNKIGITFSGGGIRAMVFHCNNMRWPNSEEYLNTVLPKIQDLLTSRSLQKDMLHRLFAPINWKYVFNRAVVVSKSIESLWGIKQTVKHLPDMPLCSQQDKECPYKDRCK
jgi:NTE family protein